MNKKNINNDINPNTNKKSKININKRVLSIVTVLAIVVVMVIGFLISAYAYNFKFEHYSDKIDMSDNSITYTYIDHSNDDEASKKTYTISDNWLSKMLIHKEEIENIGTNTTIYGPYTWLPAGIYKVTFDFTAAGGNAFEYWDVCVNFGSGGMSKQKWSSTSDVTIEGTDANVQSPKYWRDSSNMPHLEYYIDTKGNAADYELRLYFTNNLGFDLPETGSDNMDAKKAFLQSIKIEAVESNTIYAYDSEADAASNKNGRELTKTYWGQTRGNVEVPTKEGYEFLGWYGYSQAENRTPHRSGLNFITKSSEVKIWNADGTPAINTEVSYYNYKVWPKWELKSYNLTFDANGGNLKYPGNNINNPHGNISNHVTVTYSKDYYNNMSADIPYKEGNKFTGWYLYHQDGNWWEQIYDENGIAVKQDTSCFWYWNGNYAWHCDNDVTLYAGYEVNQYTLKLDANYYNVWFDKLKGDGYDLGTVDLYINGKLEAANITDWEKTYPYGTSYEFKNIKSKNGYIISDAGSLKGVIKDNTTATAYAYDKVGLTYFDKNSSAGGKGTDKYVFYNMVSLVYNKGSVIGNDVIGFSNNNKIFKYWKTDKDNFYNGGDVMPVNDDYQAKAYIQSVSSNLVMDIAWGGMSNDSGLNIQLADKWNGSGEYWSFIHANDDDYFIVNNTLGKYVTADIANMNVYYGNLDWSNNQLWTLSIAEDGCFYITSKTNPNLRITAQGTTSNSNIGLSWKTNNNSQKWKILFNNRDSIFTAQWGNNTVQDKVNVTLIAKYEGAENGTYAKEEKVINNKQYTVGDPITWVREKDVNDKVYGDVSFSQLATADKNQIYYVTIPRKTYTVTLDKSEGISAVSGAGTYRYGKKISISAATMTGYNFAKWNNENGSALSNNSTVNNIEVTDNVRYIANATIQSFPVAVNVRYQDENGNWGNYSKVISKNYNYGETVTYRRVADNTYKEVNYVAEVTSAITKNINIERKKYTQAVKVRYENADGSFTSYSEVANEDKYYGSNFSWSRNADTVYKAANVTKYTVTNNKTNEITLYRNQYTVTVNGDSHITKTSGNGIYRYGATATISADSFSAGYHFDKWNDGNTNARRTINVTGNATYTAYAAPNTNTKYTVNHWQQNINGNASKHDKDNYTLVETQNLTGTTDTIVIPKVKAYEGFTSPKATEVTINGDGKTEVNYYYTRNSYKLDLSGLVNLVKRNSLTEEVLNPTNNKNETYTVATAKIEINDTTIATGVNDFYQDVLYGSTVKVTTTASTGYTVVDNTNTLTITMPAKNTEIVPHVNANTNTKYTVKHWKQNINSDASKHDSSNYTLADTDSLTGTTNRWVTPAVKTYEGFTSPSKQTVQIKPDGSLIVNYYYTRNKYTITVNGDSHISSTSGSGTYYYGSSINISAAASTGYHFKNWNDNNSDNPRTITVTADETYTASSVANNYTLYFNYNKPSTALNNIANNIIGSKTVTYDSKVGNLPNPSLIGWDFAGWFDKNGAKYTSETIYKVAGNTTIYAKWNDDTPTTSINTTNNIATSQTVTLNAVDNGSGVASYYWGKSNPNTTNVTYNTVNPIKSSYSRIETVNSEGTYYFSVKDRNGKVSTSSITFYKTSFNTNKTHITNTNGEVITDNFTSEPVKSNFNVDYSINASNETISPVVNRDGNEFLGWNTNSSSNNANKTITIKNNATYYCIWEDSTKPAIRLDSLTSDTNTTEQTLVFSMFDTRDNGNKTGSDIKGYYIGTNKENPTANEFKKVEINANGNTTITLKINKNTFKPDTSYYIFAVDKAGNISECMTRNNNKDDLKFVTINYEANGTASSPAYLADGVLKEIYIPVNTLVHPLPKAERIGYHDPLTEQWQSLNYTTCWSVKAQYDGIAKPTRMWQADKSITLYACWDANEWTVTFDYNKPENAYYDVKDNETKSKTVSYDSAYGTLPNPSLNGWKFVGWYTEQTNGTLITKDTIVRTNSDHTLYAHWEHNSFDNGTGFTINYWTENLYKGNNQNNGYSDCTQIGKDTTDYYSNYKTVKVNKINGKSIYADETIKNILAENYLSTDEKTYLKGFTLAYSVIGGGINNSKEINTSLDNRIYHQYKDGRWIEFSSVEKYNPAINTNPSVTVHIDALGQTIIDFYYKRNSYIVPSPKTDGDDDSNKDPDKITDIVPGNGIKDVNISDNADGKKNTYKYEEVVTMTANTKDGYHWHYDSDTDLNKKSEDCYTRDTKHLYPSGWIDNNNNIKKLYTDENGKTSSLKDKTIKFYMPASDVDLSVGATNNSYKVDFEKNKPNGRINDITGDVSNPTSAITGTVNSKDYIYNHKDNETVLPESIYSITGWDFIGWSRNDKVNAETVDTIEWGYNKDSWKSSDLTHLTTDNNVTIPLYAKYVAHTYTVNIYPNKPQQSTKDLVVTKPNGYEYNKSDNVLSKTLTYDAINYIPNSFDIFKIEGWSSLSYNYKISGTKYLIDYSDTNNKQWNLSPDDKIVIDFYTRWSENTYNVKFNEQGGTKVSGLVTIMSNNNNAIVDMDNPIVKYNVKDTTNDSYTNNTYESTYKMPNAPIRPGYDFISWNINEDVDNASNINYLAGQAFSSIAGKIDNSETKLDNELTFYAIWQKKRVVTINAKSNAMGQNTIRDNARALDSDWYDKEISGDETILQEWNVDINGIERVDK
jgi:uncharacterized repeat protein (TIGR02543 family)